VIRNRRRSARRDETSKTIVCLLLGVVALAIFAIGGYLFISTKGPELSEDGCPVDPKQSPEHLVVLIDLTTPFNEGQRQNLEGFSQKLFDEIDRYSRVSLYRLNDGSLTQTDKVIEVCSPGNPKNASEWTQNLRNVQKRFTTNFKNKVIEELDLMKEKTQAGTSSEILASIRALSQIEFIKPKALETRLIIISDLIENSSTLNMYEAKKIPELSDFWKQTGGKDLVSRLNGIQVTFLYVDNSPRIQSQLEFKRFWVKYAIENGSIDSSGSPGAEYRNFVNY
jgi:hypothetical protein